MKKYQLIFRRFRFWPLRFWHWGLAVTLLIGGLVAWNLEFSDKTLFISGEPTHGHHQIELACNACHVSPFAGAEAMQQACLNCHADALEISRDTHPRRKFLDPRNAPLLASLDARDCVTCHREHKPEITLAMGVTLPGDFCFHCHSDIAEDRSSHEGFAFDSCASAGCHNYHDNRTLYEDFLIAHIDQPALLARAQLPQRTAMQSWLTANPETPPLQIQHADFSMEKATENAENSKIAAHWAQSAHAQAAVNCSSCHADEQMQFTSREIVAQCGSCHLEQREGFTRGMHGMRLSAQLPPEFSANRGAMSPTLARLPMQADAPGELNCTSCHDPHQTDLQFAAVDACLGCHSDQHSLSYRESPHFKLWQAGDPGGVSCANCHLPREEHGEQILVNHNQNHNLRPNEKMLPVCLNCHGIELALSSLADHELVADNFNREPAAQHQSFELIRERIARIKAHQQPPQTTTPQSTTP